MRSNVETKRCNCGAILALREGCKACADRKRAELHARGVCNAERPRQPYDNGKHQGNAAWYKKPPLGPKPNWLDLKLPSGAPVRVAPCPGVAVDEVAFYNPDLHEHIKAHAEELNRLYESGAVKFSRTARCDHPKLRATSTNGICPDCEGAVSWSYGSAFTIDKDARKAKHEPPPVGAGVEYAVALADMMARNEARYSCDRMLSRGFAYAWRYDGLWIYGAECPTGHASGMHLDEYSPHSFRWTRLPDAATGPAIGEECDWETAKRDMLGRSEARYRPNYPESNVHSIVDGSLLYHVGSDEGPIGPGMHEAKARSHRWVRLA